MTLIFLQKPFVGLHGSLPSVELETFLLKMTEAGMTTWESAAMPMRGIGRPARKRYDSQRSLIGETYVERVDF
jgi:hypothetical protein